MAYGYRYGYAAARAAAGGGAPAPTLGVPVAFTNNLNTTVTDQGGGSYRVTKTSGTDEVRNARANAGPIAGDCLITIHGFGFGTLVGGPEFIETLVGLNDAPLASNLSNAIEALLKVEGQDDVGTSAFVQAPGGTVVVGAAPAFDAPLFVQRIGTVISFRQGADWASSIEFNTASIAALDPLYCSILATYRGSYVDVTFQPIE
jgi:hypothetical protein